MKKHFYAVALLVLSLTGALVSAQSTGSEFVSRLELREVAGAPASANQMSTMMVDMFKKMVLPEGPVDVKLITDGQSVRTEMNGTMATLTKGSIVLYPAGQADGYVIDPAAKTYYVLKVQAPQMPAGVTLPKPEVSVKRSGTFDTIAGHRAEKVDIGWRMAMPIPEGMEPPPGMPTDFSMDIENWCATDIKMPSSAMQMFGGVAQSMPGFGLEELTKACPFALKSRMRMSMLPGYELVQTVTSAKDATPSPDLFKVPAGYKEVQPPTPKMPGM